MTSLAAAASHAVIGASELHVRQLRSRDLRDFHDLFPLRVRKIVGGISPRRWLMQCNPLLASLLDETLGDAWATDLERIRGLERFADESEFQSRFAQIKQRNKAKLAQLAARVSDVRITPDAIFHVHVGAIRESRRQHLALLYILTLYRRLLHNPELDIPRRVFIFGGKAAPSDIPAKRIVHAINAVAACVNRDARIRDTIKVAFLPNYGVSLAECIIPAADVSEQIAPAGSGVFGAECMKLAANGAVTVGTLSGANVELLEEVGSSNAFVFGKTGEDLEALRREGYSPYALYSKVWELRAVLDWLASGFFAPGEEVGQVVRSLLDGGDAQFLLADYEAYVVVQDAVGRAYQDRSGWARMAILNTARSARFSSDRMAREYARDVWSLAPMSSPPGHSGSRSSYVSGADGVRDRRIATTPFVTGRAQPSYRVFVSYGREDVARVKRLCLPLNSLEHVKLWLDDEVMRGGEDVDPTIDREMEESDVRLYFLSAQLLGRSEGYVFREHRKGSELAKRVAEGRIADIPVDLDKGIVSKGPPFLAGKFHVPAWEPDGAERVRNAVLNAIRGAVGRA